jgi:hypothetical protein
MVWCFLWSAAWIADSFLETSGGFVLLAWLLAGASGALAFPAVTNWLAAFWDQRPSQQLDRYMRGQEDTPDRDGRAYDTNYR